MSANVIDFHTHAFPDALAARAMKTLIDEAPGVVAFLDGTVASLLRSMDSAGIQRSLLCCIATKPAQFDPIFEWCRQIRSDRLIPVPSIHPADPEAIRRIERISAEGFKGVKFHPFYQDFYLDEDRMLEIYRKLCDEDLFAVVHTGYDIAFPRIRRADPARILKVLDAFPKLKLITTHLGGWEMWDEVDSMLIGRNIYMELSFGLESLEPETARSMLMRHPEDYLLFGTDSPWTDQKNALSLLRNLALPEKKLPRILAGNAVSLLGE